MSEGTREAIEKVKKDQFQLDWSMSDPGFREALDYPVAESGLVELADQASCGQLIFEDTSPAALAPMLRNLAECFERAAERVAEMEKNTETGQNSTDTLNR